MIALVSWVIFVFLVLNTSFVIWNMSIWGKIPLEKLNDEIQDVSVLIPARNEEKNILSCLEHVKSGGKSILEILVYDDCSTDNTARIVQHEAQLDPRIRLIPGTPLPEGWCGKPHACYQLARHAQGKWLLFLDADVTLVESAVDSLRETARRKGISFLAGWPAIKCVTVTEKLFMPMLNFCVFTLFPTYLAERDNRPSLGLAHGACLLMDRTIYERIGGHQNVHNKIFEDTELARVWRAHGEKTLCLDASDIVSVRMYNSFSEIWKGFQKNFYPAFRSSLGFLLFLGFHLLFFLLPFIVSVFEIGFHNLSGGWILGSLCVVISRGIMALRFRYPLWSCIFHPVAEFLLIVLGITSWWKYTYGLGVTWKDRNYHKSLAP